MKEGKLYIPTDENLMKEQAKCLEKLYDFNQTCPSEMEKREKILKELLGSIGNNVWIGSQTVVLPCVTIGDNTVL